MNETKQLIDRNQTGVRLHEDAVEAMNEASDSFPPSSTGTKFGGAKARIEAVREVEEAERDYGSIPQPEGLVNKAKAAVEGALGRHPKLLVDKLGERVAFERTGTRLYEALISKHEAFGGFEGGPSRADLLEILNDEHRHFKLLVEAIESLGGDPVAVTPSADLAGVVAGGVVSVVTDPRTSLRASLDAMLVAELTDHAGWRALIGICRNAGKDELAQKFEQAEREEREHVAKVERWIAAGQDRVSTAEAAE